MPRIRSIKPDAFTSDSLSSVSVLARWTFAGLWTYCDDEGRGRADARLIKAALFPIDDETTLADVRGALDELEEIEAVCRYDVAGSAYLHIPKWDEHQKINRPSESKFPECSLKPHGMLTEPSVNGALTSVSAGQAGNSATHGALSEPSVSPPDRKGTGKGKEQGSEHAHERVSPPDLFPDFWTAYPRKTDKAKSRKAWDKAIKVKPPQFLIEAARRYAQSKAGTEQRFILHASTWLNGQRWEDETPTPLVAVTDPSQLPPVEQSWMRR